MLRVLVIVMMATLPLIGCGKKGELRPPPGYQGGYEQSGG